LVNQSVIALLTDFGSRDAYAAILHGVIAGIAPRARVVDLCHAVPRQDIRAGAFMLLSAYRFFPPETIFVCVVDPGVGTSRRIVAVRTAARTFIGPDNGLLRWAVDDSGGTPTIVRVEDRRYWLPVVSATFHGRDVMAPAAAHLANGLTLESLGPPADALIGEPFPPLLRLADTLLGKVIYVDHFGNCVTNVDAIQLAGTPNAIVVNGKRVTLVRTYAEGDRGELVALFGSSGYLEIAINGGSAREMTGIDIGSEVLIRR
jgi:S-adenosyl-L-methionine hydrolase (adenosine-forming)